MFIRLLITFALLAVLPVQAARQALVIGNDNYTSVSKLQKAGNDATAMARELKAAGFAVQLHRDLSYLAMVKVVDTFSAGIKGGDEVMVFYAGHGVQIKNGAYLLPTDIEATSESSVEKTAYELNSLMEKLSEAKAAFSLVMVDACRDNPLKAKGRSVGNTRGLSAIEPPKGQMVVYSASKGQTALDRLSDKDANPNSVFTREFIARMKRPGVRIEDLVREVQDAVEALAGTVQHEQRPALYNEARGNFYFFGPTTVQVVPQAQAKPELLAPSARPGQVEGLSLADLEREEATRKEWAAWQARMKADFDKTVKFSGGADLKVKAWERFLAVWAQDNPQSQEDERLRVEAQAKLQAARESIATPPALSACVSPVSFVELFMCHEEEERAAKDCLACPDMVAIPAGSFEMGSTTGSSDEQPVHRVNVPAFLLGRTEVTQGQWIAVMGGNPSKFKQCGLDCPVENISWIDAQTFAHKLSQKTGKTYRLPSEAEWEYAARAGSSGKWSFGDDASQLGQYAWFDANSNGKTHPVAKKKPNAFGLYDMHGNVYEWVQDVLWFDSQGYKGAPSDGSAWNRNCLPTGDPLVVFLSGALAGWGCETELRGIRGGAWTTSRIFLRSANRAPGGTTTSRNTSSSTGLRIARTL